MRGVHESPTHAIHDQVLRVHERVLLLHVLQVDASCNICGCWEATTQSAAPGSSSSDTTTSAAVVLLTVLLVTAVLLLAVLLLLLQVLVLLLPLNSIACGIGFGPGRRVVVVPVCACCCYTLPDAFEARAV
jgi:hypothetical protein